MESPIRRRALRINTLTGSYKGLWEELRMPSPLPKRRCNHSASIIENKLFIYGGQDYSEGVFDDSWVLNINQSDFSLERWYRVVGTGEYPGPLCRHTSVVYQNFLFLYGGNDGMTENPFLFKFSLETSIWEKIDAGLPGIDSHSSILYENLMIIFGGYQGGSLINEVFLLNLDTFQWKIAEPRIKPVERAYHRSVLYEDSVWMYGGQGQNSQYLEDMWKFDIKNQEWVEIIYQGDSPGVVCGHSACVYGDVMLIFGGIKNMLKETNEMYTYDFKANNWVLIQIETHIEDPIQKLEKDLLSAKKIIDKRLSISSKSSPEKVKTSKTMKIKEDHKSLEKKNDKIEKSPISMKGRIRGNVPHSRDGHSANLFENFMIIFGGDRHQMPFNDTYAYSINESVLKK